MLVYTDLISRDEMMTDAFKVHPVKNSEGEVVPGLMEVESSLIAKGDDNVDIGCGNAFGDEEEEAGGSSAEKVNNVIDSFNYSECPFDNKIALKDYLKDYVRAVRAKLKEGGTPQPEIKEFMNQAPELVTWLLKMYKESQFYVGASFNPEGAMAFAYYKEGALYPTFVFIEKGLKQEKF